MGAEFPNSSAALRQERVICSNRVMIRPLRNQESSHHRGFITRGNQTSKIFSQCLPIDQWINGWEGISEVVVCQGLNAKSIPPIRRLISGSVDGSRKSLIYQRTCGISSTVYLISCFLVSGFFFLAPPMPMSKRRNSLGLIFTLSTNIMVLRVEKIDRQKQSDHLSQSWRDIKGQHPHGGDQAQHRPRRLSSARVAIHDGVGGSR